MQQYSNKRLFVPLVLRGNRDFTVPIFSELSCSIALDAGVLPNLQLYVDCWSITYGNYKNMQVICGYFFHLFLFAMGGSFRYLASSEM